MNVLNHVAEKPCEYVKVSMTSFMNFFLQNTLAEHPEFGDFCDGAAVDVSGVKVLFFLRSQRLYEFLNLAQVNFSGPCNCD